MVGAQRDQAAEHQAAEGAEEGHGQAGGPRRLDDEGDPRPHQAGEGHQPGDQPADAELDVRNHEGALDAGAFGFQLAAGVGFVGGDHLDLGRLQVGGRGERGGGRVGDGGVVEDGGQLAVGKLAGKRTVGHGVGLR